jgi:hypothetical protein
MPSQGIPLDKSLLMGKVKNCAFGMKGYFQGVFFILCAIRAQSKTKEEEKK